MIYAVVKFSSHEFHCMSDLSEEALREHVKLCNGKIVEWCGTEEAAKIAIVAHMELAIASTRMRVFPTSYGRSDGRVQAIKVGDAWVIQSVLGPAWFWNHVEKKWSISTGLNFDVRKPEFTMSEGKALELLPGIKPVDG